MFMLAPQPAGAELEGAAAVLAADEAAPALPRLTLVDGAASRGGVCLPFCPSSALVSISIPALPRLTLVSLVLKAQA